MAEDELKRALRKGMTLGIFIGAVTGICILFLASVILEDWPAPKPEIHSVSPVVADGSLKLEMGGVVRPVDTSLGKPGLAEGKHYIIKGYWYGSEDLEEVEIKGFGKLGGSVEFCRLQHTCLYSEWWSMTRFQKAIVEEAR